MRKKVTVHVALSQAAQNQLIHRDYLVAKFIASVVRVLQFLLQVPNKLKCHSTWH